LLVAVRRRRAGPVGPLAAALLAIASPSTTMALGHHLIAISAAATMIALIGTVLVGPQLSARTLAR